MRLLQKFSIPNTGRKAEFFIPAFRSGPARFLKYMGRREKGSRYFNCVSLQVSVRL